MHLLLSNPQVLRLFIAQALFWSCSMTGIIFTAIVGLRLAPAAGLATLPLALLMLGGLLALQPLAGLMQRRGRRAGFLIGALAGVLGGLISALSLWLDSFTLLCIGALPIGAYQASAMYYRFAALEAVSDAFKGRATACVIGGGVLAALIAPTLGHMARDLAGVPFAGTYLLIASLAALGFMVLAGLPSTSGKPATRADAAAVSWQALLARPTIRAAVLTTAAGHGLMILVMNATPLAMHGEGLDLQASGQVIQWHMLGMFLPA
ncbi:MFS transporter, partial [Stutzerimonas stutzeri]